MSLWLLFQDEAKCKFCYSLLLEVFGLTLVQYSKRLSLNAVDTDNISCSDTILNNYLQMLCSVAKALK